MPAVAGEAASAPAEAASTPAAAEVQSLAGPALRGVQLLAVAPQETLLFQTEAVALAGQAARSAVVSAPDTEAHLLELPAEGLFSQA